MTILRIDVTGKGLKGFNAVVDTLGSVGVQGTERTSQQMCFGVHQLAEAARYTETSPSIGGETTSTVEVTYRMNAMEWLTPELASEDPRAAQVLKASVSPQRMQATGVPKADG